MSGFAGAQTVLVNGNVITMSRCGDIVEAVAIHHGKVVLAGTNEEVRELAGPDTETIDAGGRTVLPGFIDTHTHLALAGTRFSRIDCKTPPNMSVDDVVARFAEEAKTRKPGEWIHGEGYNMGLIWEREGSHINRWDLDEATPNNPVQISSVEGHTGSIYSGYALRLAGIDQNTLTLLPPLSSSAMRRLSLQAGFGGDWLWVVGTKIIADGAFTGRTAAMSRPYEGEAVDPSSPQYRGRLHSPVHDIQRWIIDAHVAGLRPCIHAQGDYGINAVLDGIEMALAEKPAINHRIRLEHGGLTPPSIMARMRKLGVWVSSSISFLGGDVSPNWVYWGPERMKWTYALKSLKDYGIVAAGNGDYPVTTGNPLVGIATAMTRKAATGDILGPKQAVPLEDALRLYSTNSAHLEFAECKKGSIEPGKLGDLMALERNPGAVDPDEIRDIKADTTILAGKAAYER